MRFSMLLLLSLSIIAVPGRAFTQESVHVAVEATSLVLDEVRLRRLGVDGVVITGGSARPRVGQGGNVAIGTHVGGLEVAVWLDVARRERVVERESTQRIVVLSGSAARIASQQSLTGLFGQSVSAGPELWVEPEILEDGRIRLRVQSAVGELRPGGFGTIRQDVAVEGTTEVVVPSGTSVVIASSQFVESSSDRGVLQRGGSDASRRAWIIVTARAVANPADAFPMPAGIPEEWIR